MCFVSCKEDGGKYSMITINKKIAVFFTSLVPCVMCSIKLLATKKYKSGPVQPPKVGSPQKKSANRKLADVHNLLDLRIFRKCGTLQICNLQTQSFS
jgi:hypothetical protein